MGMLAEPEKFDFIGKQLDLIIPSYDEYLAQDFENIESEAEWLRVKLSGVCFVAKSTKKHAGLN